MANVSPLGMPSYQWGSLTLFAALAVIVTALGFEHLGGYTPCPLCLQQRYAYYFGIPAVFVAMALGTGGYAKWAAGLFLIVAVGFLVNAGLGVYQAGAEWKYWAGPQTCGVMENLAGGGADFFRRLESARVVKCDEAAWRFAGLSFAGWNAVMSLFLMATALKAAFAANKQSA